jgi:hypothetical protein
MLTERLEDGNEILQILDIAYPADSRMPRKMNMALDSGYDSNCKLLIICLVSDGSERFLGQRAKGHQAPGSKTGSQAPGSFNPMEIIPPTL